MKQRNHNPIILIDFIKIIENKLAITIKKVTICAVS